MKKLALVAPYKEYNYGTVLQAYALQKKTEELGWDAEYLNFTPIVPKPLWRRLLGRIKRTLMPVRNNPARGLDDDTYFSTPEFAVFSKGFDSFIASKIKESKVKYNPSTLPQCTAYDAYMVGSDQTWGEARTSKSPIYFLECVHPNYPKLSYAPSIGTTHISPEYLQILKEKLSEFRSLSCREKTNCGLLKSELHREVNYVLDPTLLLNASDWNKISSPISPYVLEKKYILCYILGEKKSISVFAEKLGKEKGLKVYYIVTRPLYLQKTNRIFATPESFLSLIREADTVITDSFHGTIFSINFGTQFYSFTKRESKEDVDNDRIMEMLRTFNLEDRFRADGDMSFEQDVDYSKIHLLLNRYRQQSMDYLTRTLNV